MFNVSLFWSQLIAAYMGESKIADFALKISHIPTKIKSIIYFEGGMMELTRFTPNVKNIFENLMRTV